MNTIDTNLLYQIANMKGAPSGAFNIRKNGQLEARQNSKFIEIASKQDKSGIDIRIKPFTKGEQVHIPVIITESGLSDLVYNDFFVGENADVTIVAGCGIHNGGDGDAEHSGVHSFEVGPRARIKYIEKHYGEGDGRGARVMNPQTIVHIQKDGYMEMDTSQIKGVDSTHRITRAVLEEGATLVIGEKIMTHGTQYAKTEFEVSLNGAGAGAHVVSRSVAKEQSRQTFLSKVNGNAPCSGHTECDAIIMDDARVEAIPEISANHVDASLIHEAAIGKIAGEQLTKLMTLGLTEKEAEEEIINGFLK